LTEEAKWDFQLLAKEIEFLQQNGIDLTTTGFEIPEIEMIFNSAAPSPCSAATDVLPSLTPGNVSTKLGDLWILGDHRLFCGDARRRESFEILLSGETAQLAFIDPPYNVRVNTHWWLLFYETKPIRRSQALPLRGQSPVAVTKDQKKRGVGKFPVQPNCFRCFLPVLRQQIPCSSSVGNFRVSD
jgi:hypothetical protein